ncbi:hypothetical protein [Allocoleopsis sp.]|uniref:hypothetical protein n=1 Tax=Allocoleopsis sp. TaxID=3088169 RepID=UPI002FD4FD2C
MVYLLQRHPIRLVITSDRSLGTGLFFTQQSQKAVWVVAKKEHQHFSDRACWLTKMFFCKGFALLYEHL